MRLLFIGGTGIISSACVVRALALGHDVTVLNRGRSASRPLPDGARSVQADIRQPESVRTALADERFDAVVDFVAFLPEHIRTDMSVFGGRTDQYVFISSASAYQTPPVIQPITEETPLDNPLWQYSRDKIACEQLTWELAADAGLAATVVRPSHTYDRTSPLLLNGWTDIARMRSGEPVIVQGDGTSLWTLTHTDDVAVGLVGLLGNDAALGEAFHITNSTPLTWDHITRTLAAAAGVADPDIRHVATESIVAVQPDRREPLLGDLAHSRVFDNRKIAAAVPDFAPSIDLATGAAQIIEWYDADPSRQHRDPEADAAIERLIAGHERFGG